MNRNEKNILNFRKKEIISIVGAGGKTTLMFGLADILAQNGYHVISTTTTKIFYPSPKESSIILTGCKEINTTIFNKGQHVTIIGGRLKENKVMGVSPNIIDLWAHSAHVDYIIVEADGARSCSLKWPKITREPVIPTSTTIIIAVVGADSFFCNLSEEKVFRSELFSQKTGIPMGKRITLDAIASLFLKKNGIFVHTPAKAKKIVYITKINTSNKKHVISLSKKIVQKNPRIQVIYGHPTCLLDKEKIHEAQIQF